MARLILALSAVVLLGAQCAASPPSVVPGSGVNVSEPSSEEAAELVLPVAQYLERRTVKKFGQYVRDRFTGYHVGDDIEYQDVAEDVPVHSIAPGVVRKFGWVSGYGGLVVIKHTLEDGTEVNALYGHLDLGSSRLKVSDEVAQGRFIANLGDHESNETDGERRHLHFALYQGDELRVNGYEKTSGRVSLWINPTEFFTQYGLLPAQP